MNEQNIRLAAKLYESRDAAKSLAKLKNVDFKQMIEPHTHIIEQVMKCNDLDVLPAILKISKTNAYNSSGVSQLLFLAAAVELLEPSK